MNDQTELNRAIRLLDAELDSRIEALKEQHLKLGPRAIGPETNPDVLKVDAELRFLNNVRGFVTDLTNDNRLQFYVCSFTELDDNLNQWRGYSQDGNGISIGFDFKGFKSTTLLLRRCNYNEKHQMQILKELVDWWFKQLDSNIDANIDSTKTNHMNFRIGAGISSHFVIKFVNSFFGVAPFLKHPKYEEEAEWRIVIGGQKEKLSKQIKIVDSAYILKPYYCIKLDWLPQIIQVRVGPSLNIFLNKASAQLFLTSKDMNPDLVLESDIPYRGKM